LCGERGFESVGCTTMSSASVVENDGQFAQESPCLARGNRILPKTTVPLERVSAANALVFAIFEQLRRAPKLSRL
jgi:hypothetical protein